MHGVAYSYAQPPWQLALCFWGGLGIWLLGQGLFVHDAGPGSVSDELRGELAKNEGSQWMG